MLFITLVVNPLPIFHGMEFILKLISFLFLCIYAIDEWLENEGCWKIQALSSHGLF